CLRRCRSSSQGARRADPRERCQPFRPIRARRVRDQSKRSAALCANGTAVEIPVVAAMHEPLWRDHALGRLVARASVITDGELAALECRARHDLKPFSGRTCGHSEYAYAMRRFREAEPMMIEQLCDTPRKRRKKVAK